MPFDWQQLLRDEIAAPSFTDLRKFVSSQRQNYEIFPPVGDVFRALELTPVEQVRVVLLGQDPYHGPGLAHGLSFSVAPPLQPPPSLRNMYKELEADLGEAPPTNGDLSAWAEQGVLLLNTVLTVRTHDANSHRNRGWEQITDGIISKLASRDQSLVFLLWGAAARRKKALINEERHRIFESVHPSPLSAHRGFFGSKPFSATNEALAELGSPAIEWTAG